MVVITNDTEELVKDFQESCKDFPIIYKKTENGGKHRAINRGMSLVNGEMILFMDSDDWLRKDALEWIIMTAVLGQKLIIRFF